ncbi:hypothetical protein HPP92_023932 [Vanilla planifolia]|uniref:Kinesin-like protein n=2 Tax=Vanilla planifolia TaxID=51239 RepID=A0A835PIS1_VANPL|nr:hypothetical protein HPP92_023932 [Vanilla planifolia]
MHSAAIGGKPMQRSGHQHQRQYSSDQLLVDSFPSAGGGGGKWPPGFSSAHQLEYSRMLRSAHRGLSGEFLMSEDPMTPALSSSSSSQRKIGDDVSPNELSPGILDLQSFDTELLLDMPATGFYDGAVPYGHSRRQSFDILDPNFPSGKQIGKAPAVPENKSFALEKEKPGSVAKIKVVVRKRPLNKKEVAKKEEDIITIEQHTNSLTVHETKLKVDLTEYVEKHEFVFDAVLDEDVSNDEVYRETVEPVVASIFHRTKATCFAYGQTGSGKTYTMQPLPLRASQDILRLMNHTYRTQRLQLFFSFFEIYGGKLFDLLNDRRKLCMREDGKQQVCIVGLQEYRVSNVETIRELIEKGNATRSTGTTGANEESSRSHAILQLAIKKPADGNDPKHLRRAADGSESKSAKVVGKISFIDLAGSERGADTTDNDKQTRIEGAEINKSLLALKECIRALDNDQVHIPFRGSKLTEVLRDSFIGDSRTVMISCISPSSGSCEHTLNTLRYADRVKSLTKSNNPKKDISSATSAVVSSNEERAWREDARLASSHSTRSNQSRGSSTAEVVPEVLQPKSQRDASRLDAMNSDDDLNDLLREEEELVNAHRRQVEETIDIVREEMKLLEAADDPGNQLDEYISKLNAVLSRKAVGIANLQARLALFQRRLTEHNVLVSS